MNAVNAYFVTYTLGTTLAEGQLSGGGAGEHMTSFDYAYKLEAVRDWLFAQSKQSAPLLALLLPCLSCTAPTVFL